MVSLPRGGDRLPPCDTFVRRVAECQKWVHKISSWAVELGCSPMLDTEFEGFTLSDESLKYGYYTLKRPGCEILWDLRSATVHRLKSVYPQSIGNVCRCLEFCAIAEELLRSEQKLDSRWIEEFANFRDRCFVDQL